MENHFNVFVKGESVEDDYFEETEEVEQIIPQHTEKDLNIAVDIKPGR